MFAALAVGRYLHARSGVSIKKLVQTLRTARSATIDINGQRMTLDPELTGPARAMPSFTDSPRVTKAGGVTSQAETLTRLIIKGAGRRTNAGMPKNPPVQQVRRSMP